MILGSVWIYMDSQSLCFQFQQIDMFRVEDELEVEDRGCSRILIQLWQKFEEISLYTELYVK